MNTIFKIAWRNIWRSKKRTLLTVSAVFLAFVLALFMRSMQFGSYDLMIRASVNGTGDLQLHKSGYWENKGINESFYYNGTLTDSLRRIKGVKTIIPNLQTYALISYGKQTKGVLIKGIDVQAENRQINLSGKIVRGQYLSSGDNGTIIGDRLAKFLKADIGDSLVIMGQGYQGASAYALVPVRGIFHMPSPEMNNSLMYMSLVTTQNMVNPYAPGLLTGLSIFLNKSSDLNEIRSKIEKAAGDEYETVTWRTILSDMLQTIKADNISGQIMLMILYIIAAFGIFSTELMMVMEKRKQYAVMVAVGLQKKKLVLVSVLETLMVSIVGIAAGLLLAVPVLEYLNISPIPLKGAMAEMYLQFNIAPALPFSMEPHIFISQISIILCLSLLSSLYPAYYLYKLNILKTFRS
ncbi:MAG: FtsX-like permease family protein [Bacteroidales bacterium]|jgi:ABC-type lipoprotein release transport system permease subunit|nr:FtsX-like permease family protein [Bacteroidales bacterium]